MGCTGCICVHVQRSMVRRFAFAVPPAHTRRCSRCVVHRTAVQCRHHTAARCKMDMCTRTFGGGETCREVRRCRRLLLQLANRQLQCGSRHTRSWCCVQPGCDHSRVADHSSRCVHAGCAPSPGFWVCTLIGVRAGACVLPSGKCGARYSECSGLTGTHTAGAVINWLADTPGWLITAAGVCTPVVQLALVFGWAR